MDFLYEWIKANPIKSIVIPASVSGLNFFGNLFLALQDGHIDDQELHQLISAADGFQTLVLLVIMAALKVRKS